MKRNSYLLLILAFLTGYMVWSCSKGSSSTLGNNNNGNSASISIVNMNFSQATTTVKAGTTVTWTNSDVMIHTVTSNDGSFTSGDLNKGDMYAHTFASAGTYPYHCKYHSNMVATIVVN